MTSICYPSMGHLLCSFLNLVIHEKINLKITENQYMQFNPNFLIFLQNDHVYYVQVNPLMDKWIPVVITLRAI